VTPGKTFPATIKVNSIDYLLKPIEEADLKRSINKLDQLKGERRLGIDQDLTQLLIQSVTGELRPFRTRFLVKKPHQLITIPVNEVAFIQYKNKVPFLITHSRKKFILDYSMEELEKDLDPHWFFRLNRQIIAHVESIENIHTYFNGKLKVYLKSSNLDESFLVSKERAPAFKAWLDR